MNLNYNITPPRVPITDERTGLMSREWYQFFLALFKSAGAGNATLNLDDVEVQVSSLDFDDVAAAESKARDAEILALADESVAPFDESRMLAIDDADKRGAGGTGWKDQLTSLRFPGPGASAPTWATLRDGLQANAFPGAGAMKELPFELHMPHDWKFGTNVYIHIHWTYNAATPAAPNDKVQWYVEVTYANGHNVAQFPASVTYALPNVALGATTTLTHFITEMTDAQAASMATSFGPYEPDGAFICRLFRDPADANDTFAGDAFPIYADLHYFADGHLTNEKTRTFSKYY